jgi:two-component system chemotaxis response regulator CheY
MRDNKYVILCVDDDPDVLVSLKVVLESDDYAVVTAADGKAGVAAFREEKPDLVLLDLMMEEIDAGTQALKAMQAIDRKVPVYLLSSTGDYLQGATDTDQLGLAGVFQKPVDPKILLALLRAKLRKPRPVS